MQGLSSNSKKDRKYSHDDKNFIDSETMRLLLEKIIEPSNSPQPAEWERLQQLRTVKRGYVLNVHK